MPSSARWCRSREAPTPMPTRRSGKVVAWIIGFALIFEYGISAAPVAQTIFAACKASARAPASRCPTGRRRRTSFDPRRLVEPYELGFRHSQYDVVGALFVLAPDRPVVDRNPRDGDDQQYLRRLENLGAGRLRDLRVGLFHPANLHPFIPNGWGSLQPFGGGGGYASAARHRRDRRLVFFIYIGFDTATTTAEETRDPSATFRSG